MIHNVNIPEERLGMLSDDVGHACTSVRKRAILLVPWNGSSFFDCRGAKEFVIVYQAWSIRAVVLGSPGSQARPSR